MTANAKPWVQAACVCERVLVEQDRVPSLIRIVDTYTMAVPPEPIEGAVVTTTLTAFVSVKSGSAVGHFEIGLRLVDPEGKMGPVRKWHIELRGDEHGANLKVDFALPNAKMGLYWFDVLWTDDDLLTRIPFRLKAIPVQGPKDETGEPMTETK
jgi:hypothetical protein